MKSKFTLFFCICSFLGFEIPSQDLKKDSLLQLYINEKIDSNKVDILSDLSWEYCFSNTDSALYYVEKAIKLSDEMGNLRCQSKSYSQRATVFYFKGDLDKSISDYLAALKIDEQLKDSVGISSDLMNIGSVYFNLNKYNQALQYYQESYKLNGLIKDTVEMSTALSNIGAIYLKQNELELGLEAFKECLIVSKEPRIRANLYQNIAHIYIENKDYENSLINLQKALNISEQNGLKFNEAKIANAMANNYSLSGQSKLAIEYAERALELSKELGAKEVVEHSYQHLSSFYADLNNYERAYHYRLKYIDVHDTIYNERSNEIIAEMQTKYDSEKKEKENELLRVQGKIDELEIGKKDEELKLEATRRNVLYGGIAIALLIAAFIFNRLRVTRRQKLLIQEQKKAVEEQKEIVEEKNTEITDSINYAQRIQQALLKSEEHVSDHFPPHFILLKPKDIVSGDFYWAIEKQGCLYISVADCTGHGVPGAFMSMLGIAFLNEINSGEELLSPAQILDELRGRIIRELSQTGSLEGSKDGMDMCIIRLNKGRENFEWAGANNPLYIVNGKEIKEIKADRQPVAFSDFSKPFTNHSVQIEESNCLYMFSDGYVDQFGGAKGKKFKTKRYKELLLSFHKEDMEVQKSQLDNTFESWRGDIEQIDDVCVVGLRL